MDSPARPKPICTLPEAAPVFGFSPKIAYERVKLARDTARSRQPVSSPFPLLTPEPPYRVLVYPAAERLGITPEEFWAQVRANRQPSTRSA